TFDLVPGETKAIAEYVVVAGTQSAAGAKADALASPATEGHALDLLSDAEKAEIVNFNLTPASPDVTAPASSASVTGSSSGAFYAAPAHVTVTAGDGPDGSGVAETRCVLDPASPPATFADLPPGCAYTGAGGDVSGDGAHTLFFASADAAGNQEAVQWKAFTVDAAAPASLASLTGTAGWSGW